MKHCQYCNAKFVNEDAYQIHLGVGAPAFHACNDADEMVQKGMTQNQTGEWSIDESLIEHRDNWAYLIQEPPMTRCPYCGQMHYVKDGEFYCPLSPTR